MGHEPEQEFIEAICKENWEKLYRYIYYRVQNKEEAEDITQETFVKALLYNTQFQGYIQNPIGYLRTVALNIIRDRWRRQKIRGRTINIDDIHSQPVADEDFTSIVEERYQINEAMAKLTDDQRDVLEYRILKGYSVKETSKRMNKKESTVRVLQYRGIKAMEKLMKELE